MTRNSFEQRVGVSEMNSIHLDTSRREAFRRAREVLLHACGTETINLSAQALQEQRLAIQHAGLKPASGSQPGGEAQPEPYVQIKNHQRVSLKVGNNTIGRLPDNDIVGNDAFMSRRHCAILVHANRLCELHDLASKNGTFLNGLRITSPTRLHPGDEIQIGDFRMTFMGAADHTASMPAPAAARTDKTCLLSHESNN